MSFDLRTKTKGSPNIKKPKYDAAATIARVPKWNPSKLKYQNKDITTVKAGTVSGATTTANQNLVFFFTCPQCN